MVTSIKSVVPKNEKHVDRDKDEWISLKRVSLFYRWLWLVRLFFHWQVCFNDSPVSEPINRIIESSLGPSPKFSITLSIFINIHLVGGLEHGLCFPSIRNFIIPIGELIFFRGVGILFQPPVMGEPMAQFRQQQPKTEPIASLRSPPKSRKGLSSCRSGVFDMASAWGWVFPGTRSSDRHTLW